MTFFCYGAVQLCSDERNVKNELLQISDNLHLQFDFTNIQKYSKQQLFCGETETETNLLIFEVLDAYDALYNGYGGLSMLQHYREIAKQLAIPNWQTLEFGSFSDVDNLYRITPANIPVIQFVQILYKQFSDRLIIICLDHDFEGDSNRKDVVGNRDDLITEIWGTIAFGYSWPNLRLIYDPTHIKRISQP